MIIEGASMVIEIVELEATCEERDSKGRRHKGKHTVGLYGHILSGRPRDLPVGAEFEFTSDSVHAVFRVRNRAGQIVSTGAYKIVKSEEGAG